MREIMSLLLGSRTALDDRRAFFKAQVVFWLLCAPDGHAKNFSVFLEPKGSYCSTPLYDVISAYPVLGHGRNRIAPEKVHMAMGALGKNKHYDWSRLSLRHWLSTAAACDLGSQATGIFAELVDRTPHVLAQVSEDLPKGFPASVADSILDGIRKTATKLQ